MYVFTNVAIVFAVLLVVNATVTPGETSWLAANPPLVPEEDLTLKAVKKTEFENAGQTDVNLFRNFWKWVQDHNGSGSWTEFVASDAKRDYDEIQNLKADLDSQGYTDPKFHHSFFQWSSDSGSKSISSWLSSDAFTAASTYIDTRHTMRTWGYNDVQFGYYWAWLQNHPAGTIPSWEQSESHFTMWQREYMRSELNAMGFTDSVYFRHCWRWSETHVGSGIHEWLESHDHLLLKFREEKRAELIALGHRDKEQFNRFWAWFTTSSYYDGPSLESSVPASASEVWYTTGSLSNTNGATINTESKCVNANANDDLRFSACHENFSRGSTPSFSWGGSQSYEDYVREYYGSFNGDPYLRLHKDGVVVATNDDWCGLGSEISFTVASAGEYCLHMGCYSTGSCQYDVRFYLNEIVSV